MFVINKWKQLAGKYSDNSSLIDESGELLKKQYSESHRHYHNLEHLQSMILYYEEYRRELIYPDSLLFSVFFHDFIYEPGRTDNEERSAESAIIIMKKLRVPDPEHERIQQQILATKSHESEDHDTRFLIDFDIAVLGAEPGLYRKYAENIRKEFAAIPNELYKTGRMKVLNHFLNKSSIFLTDPFIDRYEKKARKNLENELQFLSHF